MTSQKDDLIQQFLLILCFSMVIVADYQFCFCYNHLDCQKLGRYYPNEESHWCQKTCVVEISNRERSFEQYCSLQHYNDGIVNKSWAAYIYCNDGVHCNRYNPLHRQLPLNKTSVQVD
ncbi:hypothetical protein M3Y94_00954400 [Aphelenchoides besseyi]|nr:hypothetical protein M3Y94_00954400 [Aphelenchoides besseyi]KAI6224786.1 hypothetical protein M3Y95_00789300 [Aphelenchoides besseyi]